MMTALWSMCSNVDIIVYALYSDADNIVCTPYRVQNAVRTVYCTLYNNAESTVYTIQYAALLTSVCVHQNVVSRWSSC